MTTNDASARLFYDRDADLGRLRDRRIAVIGYGSQGHAHALNLRDSGLEVVVGLRPGSPRAQEAEREGLAVTSIARAVRDSEIIMVLAPDHEHVPLFEEAIAPGLVPGKTLLFAHGFSVRFGGIMAPNGVDLALVAPKSPGHRLREVYRAGGGVPALVAVENDASGQALADALAYAKGIGATRAGVLLTTFSEETETDLFGEQAVLCGGMSELIKAGFETLVEAGYQPEVAYFECLHELKLIVDLLYRGGLGYMRYSISDTAEFGDYCTGNRVIDARVKATMREVLAEIRSGQFASRWLADCAAGRSSLLINREKERDHPIEQVGQRLRAMMPFIDPKNPPTPHAAS